MKKTYYLFSLILLIVLQAFNVNQLKAAYVTVPCTGFTADVIANGIGSPVASTDSTFDAAGWYLLDSTYLYTVGGIPPAHALPASGLIHSVATSGLDFLLASSSLANSMRIDVSNAPKTLNFVVPVLASQVFVLGATGSGAGVITIAVNFTDGTSQTFTSQSLPDWFASTGFAIQGVGRVNGANSQPTGTTAPTDPRLYQKTLTLSAANYTKLISGITVTRTSTVGVINIMAVSIATPPLGVSTDLQNTSGINLYPNPVINDFYVELNTANTTINEKVTLKIYNMIGEKIYATSASIVEGNKIYVQPDKKLAAGIYVMEVEVNSKVTLQKFIVK